MFASPRGRSCRRKDSRRGTAFRASASHRPRLYQHRDRRRRRHRRSPITIGSSDRRGATATAQPRRPRAFPMFCGPGAKTLVIGPGGGCDVARRWPPAARISPRWRSIPSSPPPSCAQRFAEQSHRLYFRARSACVRRGRPLLRPSQRRKISGAAGHAGGYLGFHRGRRLRAFRKQSVHHRRFLRLSFPPDRRRRAGVHALGLRSAARIAAAGHAGDGCAGAARRNRAVAGT